MPKIDEVSKTPIPGIYELRIGAEVLYTDEQGNYLIQGSLIDTKTRVNLTEARVAKLTAIDFASLPLKDAIVIKQGSGARKLAVFGDPNCGYCKRFERDLAGAQGRHHLHLPVPDPRPRLQCQVARHLVRAGSGQGVARLDGRRHHAAQERWARATPRRSSATWHFGNRNRVTGHAGGGVRGRQPRPPGAIPVDQLESRLVAAAKR